jgi:hypothetical protein
VTKPKTQMPGQLALPFGDQADEPEWDSADSNAYQDAQSSGLSSGGDSVIRWRQVE